LTFEAQRREIIGIARRLLDGGRAEAVLSFASGGDGRAVPRFFRPGDALDAMRWDEGCQPNLAALLPGWKGKLAIVAKPCDARAIAAYQGEGQLRRGDLTVIGVACPGMTSPDGAPVPGCRECQVRTPPIWDELVPGDAEAAPAREGAPEDCSPERFQAELKKCMLCFACRQACYGCYCKTCFVERSLPDWLPPDADLGAKAVFHLGRAMHLAGRCVECGACERACPSGVKIRYLVMALTRAGREWYGHSAGLDAEAPSALTAFGPGDPESGFLGGE